MTEASEPADAATAQRRVLWFDLNVSKDNALLLVALVSGATGAFVHAASSFTRHVGEGSYNPSWFWWCILRPGIGMTLALIVYFAVRGGLLTGIGTPDDLSPYGIGAITGIAGLASDSIAVTLRKVLIAVFGEDPADRHRPAGRG